MNIDILKRIRKELVSYNFDEVILTDEEVELYKDYLSARKELMNTVTEYSEYISNPLQDRVDSILSHYENIKDYHIRVGTGSDGVAKLRVYSWPRQRKMVNLSHHFEEPRTYITLGTGEVTKVRVK